MILARKCLQITRYMKYLLTLLVLLCAVHILQAFVQEVSLWLRPSGSKYPSTQQIDIKFLVDGSYHKVKRTTTRKKRGRHQVVLTVYDANDQLIWERAMYEGVPAEYLRWAFSGHLQSNVRQMASRYSVSNEFSRILEVPVETSEGVRIAWRYQRHDRIFVGYDMQGQKVGYLGQGGFSGEKAATQSFDRVIGFKAWIPAGTTRVQMLWLTAHGLYQIDFSRRVLQRLYESPQEELFHVESHGWESLSSDVHNYVDPNLYRPLLHCRSAHGKHHVILREPNQVIHYTVPPLDSQYSHQTIRVTATRNDLFLLVHKKAAPSLSDRQSYASEKILYRIDERGTLHQVNSVTWMSPGRHAVKINPVFTQIVCMGSPLVYQLIVPWCVPIVEGQNRQMELPLIAREVIQTLVKVIPIGFGPWLLTLIMIVVTGWHIGKRERSPWVRGAWLFFVGLFNVAGLLTYLVLNHTPVIRCHACDRKRTLNQAACIHCHAELLSPQPEHTILIPA